MIATGTDIRPLEVLGATSGRLYYKLDCLRSNYTKSGVLSIEVQNQFDKYVKKTDLQRGFYFKRIVTKIRLD